MKTSTQHRLRKHPDYQRVYKTGRKQWAKQIAHFSAVREPGSQAALRSETPGPRVGLTVPKALGKAVDRNRIKRRLREIVRHQLQLLGDLPVDVILHPKRTVLEAEFTALEQEVRQIFKSVRARASARPTPPKHPARPESTANA
jgi:ribonuclease P protein component